MKARKPAIFLRLMHDLNCNNATGAVGAVAAARSGAVGAS